MGRNIITSAKHNIRYWWVSLIIGLLAVAVGVLSSIQPIVTIEILTIFFIAYFLVSGFLDIIVAVSNRKELSDWGWTLISGIVSLIFAIILLALPDANMGVFIYYVAFYLLLQSIIGVRSSLSLKRYDYRNWWMFLTLAILGIILSLIMVLEISLATTIIVVVFATTLICYGLFRVFYAFKLKKIKDMFDK